MKDEERVKRCLKKQSKPKNCVYQLFLFRVNVLIVNMYFQSFPSDFNRVPILERTVFIHKTTVGPLRCGHGLEGDTGLWPG